MIAIKFFPRNKMYAVYDGVMDDYVEFSSDGTFTGSAGISIHRITKMFNTLEEAKQAKQEIETVINKWR